MMRLIFIALGLTALANIALGHHQTAGRYSDTVFEVEGEVVAVLWGNPHPRITIRARTESGETDLLYLESGGLGNPERMGLPRDILQVGDNVTVAVRAPLLGRRHDVLNILLPNDSELVMNQNAEPRWPDKGDSFRPTNRRRGLAIDEANVGTSRLQAQGIFRVWSVSSSRNWQVDLPLTAAARAAQAEFVMERDYPLIRCVPPGMPRAVLANAYPMEFIERDGEILMRLEEFDNVRTIHMAPGSTAIEPTPLGFSVGRWESNDLVVATTDINWPYFSNSGVPQSESVEILERFTLSEDGSELKLEVTIVDPITFTEPVTGTHIWTWIPGQEVKPYDCALDE